MTEQAIDGRIIRGLTLWRPWPWAFRHAGKRVENRTWPPPRWMIGAWLGLHAGEKFDTATVARFQAGDFNDVARRCPSEKDSRFHPSGVIDAVARVTGCYRVGDRMARSLDRWAFGPVVWQLEEYTPIEGPVRCKGSQGLWKLPSPVFEAIREQLSPSVEHK